MDRTWTLHGISSEAAQDVRHGRERHPTTRRDEETSRLELRAGPAARVEPRRVAIAWSAEGYRLAPHGDEDPALEVFEPVSAALCGDRLGELPGAGVVDLEGARHAQGKAVAGERGGTH